MKKLLAIAASTLLLVGLTGCAGNSSSAPTYTPDPTPTYTPDPQPTYTNEEIYIKLVRATYPSYAGLYSDSELLDIANSACTYFRDGGDFESLAYSLVASLDSTDPDFFGFVGFTIGSGVEALCPQYSYLITS